MTRAQACLLLAGALLLRSATGGAQERMTVPRLAQPPRIDGDLSEWTAAAFTDGAWTIERLAATPWYQPDINRLTIHAGESGLDLEATYYLAWDEEFLYLGAEVRDNVNDVVDPALEDKRWYYKDAVCWFIEAPRDGRAEMFGQGDNAFCFVADASRPAYGAWWRHGAPGQRYLEEPLSPAAAEYALRFDPWGRCPADFVLEARVRLASTLAASDPDWQPPAEGDEYGLEIVHTDPDGEGHGGHFLVYGRGDDDSTWGTMVLGPEVAPTVVEASAWGRVKAAGGWPRVWARRSVRRFP